MSQLAVYDICQKISGWHQFWKCYVLGTFTNSIVANNTTPDVLVRYHEKDKWAVSREFVSDLRPLGSKYPGPEPGLQQERLTWFAVETSQPPPVLPPVDPPPVVIPPPVDPPPVTPPPASPIIKMTIEQTSGTPICVGSWFEPGILVTFFDSHGGLIGKTKTGSKGSEYGQNSFEAGYVTRGDGDYILDIGEYQFIVPIAGAKRFTKLSFEHTGGLPPVILVRLVSQPMARSGAELVLVDLDQDAETRGIFKIEVIK